MFTRDDIISSYSRAQAMQDGVLVDVTQTAREAGFRVPVALTADAWESCVAVPQGVVCQDEAGRLWDVLWMLRLAIGRSNGGANLPFRVYIRQNNRQGVPPMVQLNAVCGPGDGAEPVITIMLPDED